MSTSGFTKKQSIILRIATIPLLKFPINCTLLHTVSTCIYGLFNLITVNSMPVLFLKSEVKP